MRQNPMLPVETSVHVLFMLLVCHRWRWFFSSPAGIQVIRIFLKPWCSSLLCKSSRFGQLLKDVRQHCTENLKHIFREMKLCCLVPNFYIHVSVSDLYILTIGPRQTDRGNTVYRGGSDKSGIFFFLLSNDTAQLKIIRFD